MGFHLFLIVDLLLTSWTEKGPFVEKSGPLFLKSGPFILAQNSGLFICEGGSFKLTEPPGYGPAHDHQELMCTQDGISKDSS